jgi:hypothetical protein
MGGMVLGLGADPRIAVFHEIAPVLETQFFRKTIRLCFQWSIGTFLKPYSLKKFEQVISAQSAQPSVHRLNWSLRDRVGMRWIV